MIELAQQIPDDATVTPGIAGFAVFALLAVIVVLLVLNMSKHLRKIDLKAAEIAAEEEEQRARAEAAESAGQGSGADADTAGGPPKPATPPHEGA